MQMRKKMIFSLVLGFLFVLTQLCNFSIVSAEESKEEITQIVSSDLVFGGYMIAVGDEATWKETQEVILGDLSFLVGYNENDGEAVVTASTPDWDSVNLQAAGTYQLTISLALDEEYAQQYTLASSLQTATIPICISDPDAFELFLARVSTAQFRIYFLPELDSLHTEIYSFSSETSYSAEELANCDWQLCDETVAFMKSKAFSVNRNALTEQTYTYFYLQTDDLQSQIIEIYEDGEYYSVIAIKGDRDGGDANLGLDFTFSQPAPTIPVETTTEAIAASPQVSQPDTANRQGNNDTIDTANAESQKSESKKKPSSINRSEPADSITQTTISGSTTNTATSTISSTTTVIQKEISQIEYSDDNTDTISGYRMRLMMEQSGGVAKFSKHNVTIEIPEDAFSIQDTDMITVSIQPNELIGTYDIHIYLNDVEIEPKCAISIWFPKSLFSGQENPTLEVNGTLQLLKYDEESGSYRIETELLGTFLLSTDTIADSANSAVPSNQKNYVLLIIGASILLLVTFAFCTCLFKRKQRA